MLAGLTEKQCKQVDDLLIELLMRAEAEALFLCNRGGYILAESLVQEYEQNDNIAALAAGSFFATREIARLVGEPEFHCVFHQGDRKGIYMQNTKTDLLIVVVFGKKTNPGLVKLCTEEMGLELDACLKNNNESDVETEISRIEMDPNPSGLMFETTL